MYFGMKSYLKSTRNHTSKHALYLLAWSNLVSYNLSRQLGFSESIHYIKKGSIHVYSETPKPLQSNGSQEELGVPWVSGTGILLSKAASSTYSFEGF